MHTNKPSSVLVESSTRSAATSEPLKAPAKAKANRARSRLPVRVSVGQRAIILVMTSAVAGALPCVEVLMVLRMPRKVALTALVQFK